MTTCPSCNSVFEVPLLATRHRTGVVLREFACVRCGHTRSVKVPGALGGSGDGVPTRPLDIGRRYYDVFERKAARP